MCRCMLGNLIPFTTVEPPEGVDLFVCGDPDDEETRCYGIMQFFEKGTLLPEVIVMNAPIRDERIIAEIFRQKYSPRPAPETGFYFLETDEHGESFWFRSHINPLDAAYAVINPEDLQ